MVVAHNGAMPGRRALCAVLALVAALGAGVLVGCSDDPPRGTTASTGTTTSTRAAGTTGPTGGDEVAGSADCGPAATMTPHRDLAYADVEGVEANLLALDVYEPGWTSPCGPVPVLIWVHGGGWRQGDKANRMADKVDLARELGWVLVSVNYRLSEPGPDGAPLVTYPTHNRDVADAVAWTEREIAAYGGDPTRLTLLGHSAGAGIVSSVAVDPRYLADAGVSDDAVDCVASLDTEAYDVAAQVRSGSAVYRNAFGDDPAVWAEASPLTHVTADRPLPAFLVVVQDRPARRELNQRFVDAVTAAGGDATLVAATGLGHEGINAAVGAEGDTIVTPALVDFLDSCAQRAIPPT